MFVVLGPGFAIISVIMALLWGYQLKNKNASHVDVAWAYGIGLLAGFYCFVGNYFSLTSLVAFSCCIVWSIRLGTFLFFRIHGKPEDSRYRDLRESWGQVKFFAFYQFQALAVLLFSIPILVAMAGGVERDLGLQDFLGAFIALGSIFGELIADRQLSRFKENPLNQGKTCREGLWRYSRHPNYFFEWLHWFAYPFFAWGSSYFWLSFLGPVVMLILIFGVSGIPPSEARALKTRGDDYRDYKARTSSFIPWKPL